MDGHSLFETASETWESKIINLENWTLMDNEFASTYTHKIELNKRNLKCTR